MYMNKRGFTLIELLAVIIILGILMIIAIPSVTRYISDSRKNAYVDTAKEVIGSARNLVNSGSLGMYNTNTTYYIPVDCIKTENALKSPYGDFIEGGAYVGVIYDGKGYNYYWISVDDAGQGVRNITRLDKLDTDDIESDLKKSDITDVVESTGIGNRTEINILKCSNNTWDPIMLSNTNNNVPEEGGEKPDLTATQIILKTALTNGEIVTVDETDRVYIYSGANPSNYVSFNGETWRIFGIYGDNLKLVKKEPFSKKYNESSSGSNAWQYSDLITYLNKETEGGYYYSLSSEAKAMIVPGTWYAGSIYDGNTPAYYAYPIAKNTPVTNKKVGIMATYEYLYASGIDCQYIGGSYQQFVTNSGCAANDWLIVSKDLYTLTPTSMSNIEVWYANSNGNLISVNSLGTRYVAPMVFLNSNVKIVSGDGTTPSNAYVLELQ